MKRQNSSVSTYLQEIQRKRKQKLKRQAQMMAVSSDAVPLKPISLDSKQKQVISAVQVRSQQEHTSQVITPDRLSLLISLALHFIVAMVATLYIVHVTDIDDDAVIVDFIQAEKPPKPKRRTRFRVVKRIERPKSLQIQPPQLQQITTAIQIPTGDARFTLPASDLSIPVRSPLSRSGEIGTGGLEKKLLTGNHRAKIPSVIPEIEPNRSIASIIDKIESTKISQTDFKPDAVDALTAELGDVTQAPHFLHKVSPKYPELARRVQRDGVVWLEASIGIDGTARDIQVIKGIGFGCDKAAIEALKASRFAPAKQDKQLVIVRIQIPYRFKLED